MKIQWLADLTDSEVSEMLAELVFAGVEIVDVNNGTPTLYRGYMSVKHSELWEVDSHGRREYWVMSHCPFSTRYMWKYRYVVTNHYRVINGVSGNTWHECKSYALRAAGLYGEVYRYDFGGDGKWKAVEKIYGGRKNA